MVVGLNEREGVEERMGAAESGCRLATANAEV